MKTMTKIILLWSTTKTTQNTLTTVKLYKIQPCNHGDFFYLAQQPPVGQGLLFHKVSRSHTMMHHSRYDSSGWVISSSQKPLPDSTQHSQQINIHALGGIQTHNISKWAATDLHCRLHGHRDRLSWGQPMQITIFILYYCGMSDCKVLHH